MIGQRPHQALLILAMAGDDPGTLRVGCLGIAVVLADEVGRDSRAVVGVGLPVGHRRVGPRYRSFARLEVSQQQLVPKRVVALGLCEGDAVLGVIGQAHAEAVRLNTAVAVAILARPVRVNEGKESTLGVCFDHVGIDAREELVVDRPLHLDAIERFGILAVGLASNRVGDARSRHQIAFVGGVEEHSSAKRPP